MIRASFANPSWRDGAGAAENRNAVGGLFSRYLGSIIGDSCHLFAVHFAVDEVGENLYLLRFRLDKERSRGSKFWLVFRSTSSSVPG
jgi:hypothetical protein